MKAVNISKGTRLAKLRLVGASYGGYIEAGGSRIRLRDALPSDAYIGERGVFDIEVRFTPESIVKKVSTSKAGTKKKAKHFPDFNQKVKKLRPEKTGEEALLLAPVDLSLPKYAPFLKKGLKHYGYV